MIGSLRGQLLEINPRDAKDAAVDLLVETNGVGYRICVPAPVAAAVGVIGSTVFLHVHTVVREDALTLYGFLTRDELKSFESLIGAHGVGPSVAVAIVSVHSPSALYSIVENDDIDSLCDVPGIGKKSALKLLVELKSRLNAPDVDLVELVGGGSVTDNRSDVRSALDSLGYSAEEIRDVLNRIQPDSESSDMLREALQILAGSR